MKKTGSFRVRLETAVGAEVSITVENIGPHQGVFCTYHTPFEGIRNNIFVVKCGDRELDYCGKMAKRVPPGPEDHRALEPGERAGPATVDLATAYDLTPGVYSVRYRGSDISGLPDSDPIRVLIER